MSEQQRTGVFYVAMTAPEYDQEAQRYAYKAAMHHLSISVGEAISDRRRYIVQYLGSKDYRDNDMFIREQVQTRVSVLIALADPNDCKIGEYTLDSAVSHRDIGMFTREPHGLAKRVQ